jgi:hypothetical protein
MSQVEECWTGCHDATPFLRIVFIEILFLKIIFNPTSFLCFVVFVSLVFHDYRAKWIQNSVCPNPSFLTFFKKVSFLNGNLVVRCPCWESERERMHENLLMKMLTQQVRMRTGKLETLFWNFSTYWQIFVFFNPKGKKCVLIYQRFIVKNF